MPKLSKEAMERLEQLSKSHKMTPSQVILKLLPQPKPTVKSILKEASRMTAAEAEAILEKHDRRKSKVSSREANQIADEAVSRHRDRRARKK